MRYFILLALVATILCGHAQSPVPIEVDPPTVTAHRISKTFPAYPPIAKAAHVTGTVKMQVSIDAEGKVTRLKAVSGPPMLIGSAEDCVRQWVYRPFLKDGSAVPITTLVTINFDLADKPSPNDEKTARAFFPLQKVCVDAVRQRMDSAMQAQSCTEAAQAAEQFTTTDRFIERRSAFVYAATALRRNNQLHEALEYADKAVDVVAQGHDDGSGASAAYEIRGQVEAQLGTLPAALTDFTKAEEYERSAIEKMNAMEPEFSKRQYIPVLKNLLIWHANVLRAGGDEQAAQAKSDEAAKL